MKHIRNRKSHLSQRLMVLGLVAGFCLMASSFYRSGAASGQREPEQQVTRHDAPLSVGQPQQFAKGDSISQLLQARLSFNESGTAGIGYSVALSGNTALVGALNPGLGGTNPGAAYIFQRTGASWNMQARLIPDGDESRNNLGISVALSGDTAVVARPYPLPGGEGAVFIFKREGMTWSQQARLANGSRFYGRSVALSGNTLLVGDNLAVTGIGHQTGTAYVYRFDGSTWQPEGQLSPSNGDSGDSFGISVALSGDTALVGAYGDNTFGGGDAGSAYIYQRNGATWSEQAHLIPADTAAGDFFGWSVALSHNTAVIGCYNDDVAPYADSGSVYIYERSDTTWSERPKLVASNAKTNDKLGYSVAINGDTIVAGAYFYDTPTTQNAGAAYIFQRFNSTWAETSSVVLDNPAPGDLLGTGVAISDTTIAVGSPNADIPERVNIGSAFVYTLRPTLRNTGDFDGDGLVDLAVFRPTDNTWYVRQSGNSSALIKQFGASEDRIVPGDYDGDGKTDVAVFRPSNSTFYILHSSNNILRVRQFGTGGDVPAPGDYDGNGLTDPAVFRPGDGTWYAYIGTTNSIRSQQFGQNGDRPVPADYDGDGKTDFAVFRPSNNTWYILQSLNSALRAEPWGASGDIAVPGDYDGDTKTDVAVFRPSEGGWFILQSSLREFRGQSWGTIGDTPAPGDFNGDGKEDIAVFRPSDGYWYILQSGSNSLRAEQWGSNGDVPVPSPLP